MAVRDVHVGKSQTERDVYARYIKKQDYEPTINESISLGDSDQAGQELKEPTELRKRPTSLNERIEDHIETHWLEWLLAIIIALISYLSFDTKIDIARIYERLTSQFQALKELKDAAKDETQTNQAQQLLLREHAIKLQNMEDSLKESKK